jgi:hypothetical protein
MDKVFEIANSSSYKSVGVEQLIKIRSFCIKEVTEHKDKMTDLDYKLLDIAVECEVRLQRIYNKLEKFRKKNKPVW